MSPVQEKYELIMQEAGKFLAAEGFRPSGRNFRKQVVAGVIRWSICPQKSRASTAERIKFTCSITAEWKKRPAWYEDFEPLSTWYGAAGGRIGFLMPEKQDTWWEVHAGTSAPLLSDQFNAVLSSCVLPFLRQFQSELEITDYLKALGKAGMRWNYPHAFTMLEFDLLEKKEKAEIRKRIRRIRFLGIIHLVPRAKTETKILRVLKNCGYDGAFLKK